MRLLLRVESGRFTPKGKLLMSKLLKLGQAGLSDPLLLLLLLVALSDEPLLLLLLLLLVLLLVHKVETTAQSAGTPTRLCVTLRCSRLAPCCSSQLLSSSASEGEVRVTNLLLLLLLEVVVLLLLHSRLP